MKQHSRSESTVPRLRERMREATEQALLNAAEGTLAAEGIQAAKIETIAARAGVAVGTVYNYFQDRDHLLTALLTARKADAVSALDRVLEETAGKPWRAQLDAFVHAFLEHVEAHRAFFTILFMGEWLPQRTVDAHGPECTHPRLALREIYLRMDKLTSAGVKAGVLRAQDGDLFPALLIGMMRGLIVRELYQQNVRPLTEIAQPLIRMFLKGAEDRSR